jgi:hypothetical protein
VQDSQPGELVNLRTRRLERSGEHAGAHDRFGWIEVAHAYWYTPAVVSSALTRSGYFFLVSCETKRKSAFRFFLSAVTRKDFDGFSLENGKSLRRLRRKPSVQERDRVDWSAEYYAAALFERDRPLGAAELEQRIKYPEHLSSSETFPKLAGFLYVTYFDPRSNNREHQRSLCIHTLFVPDPERRLVNVSEDLGGRVDRKVCQARQDLTEGGPAGRHAA